MLLADLAATSAAVAATSSRTAKTALLAERLRAAAPEEVLVVAAYLAGELRQRRTGVGWASLRDLPAPAGEPGLTVLETDVVLGQVAAVTGAGAQAARRALLDGLFARATTAEQHLLRGLLSGELRQGALDALVVDAVAKAAALPAADVRRAVMLRGAVGPVAVAALTEGAAGVGTFRLEVGRPVRPMLASPAADLDDALGPVDGTRGVAVDVKIDGIRVQVHRDGDEVAVFTRTLDDVTDRLPELVEAALRLPAATLVLDGEAIALRPDGRPEPFQVTASRTGSRVDVAAARARSPLSTLFFDVLHVDGEDLLGTPLRARAQVLERLAPADQRVGRLLDPDRDAAAAFTAAASAAGHEGVVVKDLDSVYEAGRRGAAWRKVKPVHTLDLLVLAAEWGHGRRSGWLSNLHLGARDPSGGPPVMLGKTFKGLTDAMLTWQTEQLLALEVERRGITVVVRPELVVEVAFDGVQDSPRYPGGVALRFARVVRHRPDKAPAEADTLEAVLATRG